MTHDESSIEPPIRVPFSRTTASHAELAQAGGGDEAGHAGPCDDGHVRENVGLCSTYSMRTRSGPQRKAA